jgi:hypothetical protein
MTVTASLTEMNSKLENVRVPKMMWHAMFKETHQAATIERKLSPKISGCGFGRNTDGLN